MKQKIDKIEKFTYQGPVFNVEVKPKHPVQDDQYFVQNDTGIVVHNCHPRDNIALRHMAQELGLGYDLFGAIMDSREIQAKNMALELLKHRLPVVIVGKAYKPNVDYTEGSPSILVGSFVKDEQELYYLDELTGDHPPEDLGPAVYLLAHNYDITYFKQKAGSSKKELHLNPPPGSVIVDPWRTQPDIDGCTVIHYGNTR